MKLSLLSGILAALQRAAGSASRGRRDYHRLWLGILAAGPLAFPWVAQADGPTAATVTVPAAPQHEPLPASVTGPETGHADHPALAMDSTGHSHSHVPPGLSLIGFLSAGYAEQSDNTAQTVDGREGEAEADFLLTVGGESLRFLAEGVLSNEEAEIERVQLGIELAPGTLMWLGRVHQPSTYWNTEFHHGQYLQTSITRPAIESWEDDGGPLAQHVVGVLLETERSLADGTTLRLSTSAGLAPSLVPTGLEPVGPFKGYDGLHLGSYAARLDVLPDGIGEQAYGFIVGTNGLAARGSGIAGLDHVHQTTFGAYGDIQSGPMRWLGTVYRIRNSYRFAGNTPTTSEFSTSWFLHGERRFGERWLAYIRQESTTGGGPRFSELFPDFIAQRTVGGMRFEFAANHALSVEFGRAKASAARFTELRLQWSAVFD